MESKLTSMGEPLPVAGAPDQANSPEPQRRLARTFYLAIALTIAVVVVLGFGPTLNARLIHPLSPRPFILHLHVALFISWVLIFIAQTALVRGRRIDWHMRLGLLGVAIGAVMPVIGVATALAMTRLEASAGAPRVEGEAFLAVSFFDMVAFAITFWLAVGLRRRRDYHRRLMLMASCGLTVAAFARFPSSLMPTNAWYLGVDGLILAALVSDLVAERRVHPVYAFGLPVLMIGQATAMWIYLSRAPGWLTIARAFLR